MLRYLPSAPWRYFALFTAILGLQLLAGRVLAQTDPTPQSLPYTQSFSTFDGGSTTYPAGWQGWTNSAVISGTVITGPATGDQSLFAGQNNATSAPFVGDMVNKMGLLSGASVKSICLALNTTSVTSGNVQLIYTVATQGQAAGGYIDELDLQYRVGTSGSFTTIPTAYYRNDALSTTTAGGTTAYNPSTFYVLLPAACNNQLTVEIRWIPRNVSGSGTTHPGFSISNITAQQNTTTEYYSKSSGNLDNIATWGVNTDGTGAAPSNFVANAQVFHISNGNPGALGGNWTVSGTNSKIIVDGTNFTNTALNTITATIDVNAGRTLTLQNGTFPVLGNLHPLSTVVFSNLAGVSIPVVTPAYGSITFSNATVALPAATQKVMFAGNFTLQSSASFNGANLSGQGYSLVSYGTGTQVINANGLPLTVYNLDIGSTNAKPFGTVTLATNTTMTLDNSLIMVLNGTSPQFADGGNTINIVNNLDCGGASSAYNFTGTISLNSTGLGSCNIRGGGSPALPCVAAVNNLVLNNTLNVKVNPNAAGITFTVKGNLTVSAAALGLFNLQGNTVAIGGNFNYANTNASLLTMGGTSTLQFNGAAAQTYSCSATGGLSITNLTMSNTTGGLTLTAPLSVTGITTLTSGVIITGTNALNIGSAGSVTGANASSYVNGNLSKSMLATGSTSMAYEVGDLTYSPVKLTFSTSQNSGSISVKSTSGAHPSIATSYINTANFVNRYWSITTTSVNPATVDVALSYNSSDITGGLGSNTGYIIRQYSGSAWTTALAETNTTSAVAPLLPYASTDAGVVGTVFAGDYVAGAKDCTPTPGITVASPASICASGTTTLSLSGATTNTGNTYQWQSSPDGSIWTNISGATAATYTTSVIATSTYYQAVVGCIPTTATANAISAQVPVYSLPASVSGALSGCVGTGATLTDASGAGTWTSGNTAVATIGSASGTYSAVSVGTAVITYTAAATGCTATAVLTLNPTPPAPVISPLIVTLCPGSVTQFISTTADTLAGSFSGSSGTVSIPIPYNVGATSTIAVSGIPSGAIITDVSVKFSTSYAPTVQQRDYIFNLKAPNGNIINLDNGGGSSTNGIVFTDVTIGSSGTAPITALSLTSGTVYAASLASPAPSTSGFTPPTLISNVTTWSSLYSTPNGNWTLIADDKYAPTTNATSISNWSLTISYIAPPNITWSPLAGLYTDAGATVPYTGTSALSLFAKPAVTTTYNATAAIGSCTSSTSIVALLNSTIYVPSISGANKVCAGSSITLTDSASGGVWACSGAATIGSSSGIVTGTSSGTSATITYTFTSGTCIGSVTKIITVNPLPAVAAITGITNLCFTGTPTTTLSDLTAGGVWSSSNASVAPIGTSGTVTGIAPGSSVISYRYSNGTCSNSATTTVNFYSIPSALTVSPFPPICAGSPAQILTASGGVIYGGAVTANSGAISVSVSAIGAVGTSSLTIAGIPAGAVATDVAVTLNFNSSYLNDYQFNLVAPNGSILNLINMEGPHGAGAYTNTIISSSGTNALNTDVSPFTGTYAADLLSNFIPGYNTTTSSWSSLYSVPNGKWTLVAYNNSSFVNAPTTLTGYSITVNYSYPVAATWAPVSGLYTNTSGTAYTGTTTDTVYASPASTTVYTVTAANGTCSSTTTAVVSINSAPSAILGPTSVCQGSTVVLSDIATGGTWTSSNPGVANIGSTGTVTPGVSGTATISYAFSGSCYTSTVFTVNPSTAILGTPNGCLGGTTISLSDATAGGSWSSTNTSVASVGTGSGLVTIGALAGTSTISYVLPTGCSRTQVVTVNPVPAAPSISPSVLSLCPSGPAQQLVAYGDSVTGPKNDSTGPVIATLFSVTPTLSTININGIPTGVVITNVRATINGHGTGAGNSKEYNFAFNLQAPNGSTVSLSNAQGSSAISDFPYITFGSDGTTALPAVAGPTTFLVSGVDYIANLVSGVPASIPAASRSNTTSWSSLYSIPNGVWTLIGVATYNPAAGLDTVKGWSLSIDYYVPPSSVIWSPNSGLYTNSAGTIAYTGTSTGNVYAAPSVTTTYNVTAAIAGCTSTVAHVVANVSSTLFVAPISGANNVCVGSSITLSDATVGGTWSSLSTNVSVGSTGVVTGISSTPGTATITYTYNLGTCSGSATKVVTINAIPGFTPITGNTTLCLSGSPSSILSDATTGGTWTSSNTAVAAIGTSGTLTGLSVGTSVITYTYSNAALCTNTATTTVTVSNTPSPVSVSPSSSSKCPGDAATMLVASGGIISATTSATTGTINIDASAAHTVIATPLSISLPAGATITDVAVTLNFTSSFLADFMFDLQAPNGNLINLVNQPSGAHAASYTNTVLSSNGVTALSTGSSPFTGTFAADLASSVIPTYSAPATSWPPLYSTPNGNWTLVLYNTYFATTASSFLTGYAITINYTVPVATAWSPATGLYTNPGGTTSYIAGTLTNTVYAVPATGVSNYTAIATNGACAGTAGTATVTVNPATAAISGNLSICIGATTSLTDATTGGSWSTTSSNASVVGSSGVVTGLIAGTAIITYTPSNGCITTAIVTVNSSPGNINGTLSVCQGLTTQLTDVGSGTWTSSNGNATVSGSGLVNGVNAGTTATITYTASASCFATAVVTVNANPGPINGVRSVCQGFTTQLSDGTGGGSWSTSNPAIGSVDATGLVTGILCLNTATITYTLPTTCSSTATVTVNCNPGPINGTLSVCQGLTTQLTDATGGGSWTSNNASVASAGSAGVVTGNTGGGTATIIYTLTTGCNAQAIVTVNNLPSAITGTLSLCRGNTAFLSDASGGGTWSISPTSVATIGSTDGSVFGVSAGTATATYTAGAGCNITAVVTVNPVPGPINGTLAVCQGLTTQLTDADAGGAWTSSTPANASVGTSGLVTGNVGGTSATIYYSFASGCSAQAVVVINSLPSVITGTMSVCSGGTVFLSDASGGGTWSSTPTSVATIGSGDGSLSGVSAGTATVTYTSGAGCIRTATVTVNPVPGAINGTLAVCQGLTTQLTDADAGGTWASSNITNATVGTSGLVTGNVGGTSATISYSFPTGCSTQAVVVVNTLPAVITGTLSLCQGTSVFVSDASGGGTWASNPVSVATVGSGSGALFGVSAGTVNITYTSTANCIATTQATVNAAPGPIHGAASVCEGKTITLSDDVTGGTWSSGFANISVDGSGGVTGITGGDIAIVTYTMPGNCFTTTTILVNSSPSPITGVNTVCVGSTTALTDAGGGTWLASNGNASVDPTGLVAGLNAGTTIITYTILSGCTATTVVTINDVPSAILGLPVVSVGFTTTLSDVTGGGTWSSNLTSVATIGSSSGIVTGVIPGTTVVSYTLGTGCAASVTVTVNATPPPITGKLSVCVGSTTILSDIGIGTWSTISANATVGSASAVVTGVSAGPAVITFTFNAGGAVYATVTVDPLPLAISGPGAVCVNSTITLSDASPGGTWSSSSNASVGTGSGIVTGITAGIDTVSYTFTSTGCAIAQIITVNALPAAISGSGSVCVGSATTLTDLTVGGVWTAGNANVTVGSSSGVVIGAIAGSSSISYTLPTGCYTTMDILVNPLPNAIMGSTNICVGQSTTLSDGTVGLWSSSNGNVTINVETGFATGVIAGTSTITFTLSTGCFITTVVTANPIVVPSVSISKATGDTVCSGTSIVFTAIPSNGGTSPVYEWDVNGSPMTGATNSTFNYAPSGTDTVTVMLTSNAACAIPATVFAADTFFVIHTDTSAVSIQVAPNDTVCLGSYALFTALGTNGGSSPVYIWSVNGVEASTGIAYGYMPENGDNVYCKLVSSLRCVAADTVSSSHIIMTVDTSYIPSVEISATPGTSVSSTQTVTFNATVANAGPVVAYQWFINTIPVAGATSSVFTHAYFAEGDSVSCAVVSVGPCGYASFNAVKMHVLRTGVQQVTTGANDIRLIPNPNKGQFAIKGTLASNNDEDIALEITDMLGQVIYKSTVKSIAGNIDEQVSLYSGIANGMYLLNLHTDHENIVFHFVVGQ